MDNRCDRREFIKIIRSAAIAPCILRAADAMTLGISCALGLPRDQIVLASSSVPNQPIGLGKGLYPGRVVWAHDPKATNWEGPGKGHWWESDHTNQAVVDSMMSGVIQRLGGKASNTQAWDALIKHFNQTHGNGNVGYEQ